jgi:hypothetical protein
MSSPLEYTTLCHTESIGSHGAFGIKIMVAAGQFTDFKAGAISDAVHTAERLISSEVKAARIEVDEVEQQRAQHQRRELLALFPAPIFVEAIGNGYCPNACCRHLPWFVVTTTIGRFKIGWRKRVIELDWSGTLATKTAAVLFPGEEVTKFDRTIHAWGYDAAQQYIAAVIESATAAEQTP